MLKRLLRHDRRGVGAVEFALVAPVLITFIIGVSQMGKLFFANADMRNAIAAGARVASVWPVPEDDVILAAVNGRLVRSGAEDRTEVTIDRDVDESDNPFIDINMTYSVPLDFIFFTVTPVSLSDTRRVFIQVDDPLENNNEGEGGTTSATSSGDGGTTSSTSSGDASTSSTSASSTGGTTSSTSASSTGSTTSTTTSSTSSGSNGNGSSGNNNGSSGHAHGNCNNHC